MNRQEIKQNILNGFVILILVIILSAVDLALSGSFELNQDTLNRMPITVFRSSVIVMAWTYAYVTAKDIWRKRSTAYNKVREQLYYLKSQISAQRLTKAFESKIQKINSIKRMEMARVKSNKIKTKLDNKIANIERKITILKYKGKATGKVEHSKKMVELEIAKYNKIFEGKDDKATKTLIYKLTKNYKPITQSSIWVQTSETFERFDVSSNDRGFMLSKIIRGVFTSSFTLIVIGGLAFEAGRTGKWEVWVMLILTIGLLVGNYVSGTYQGKNFILNNELITRMNSLSIAQEFYDDNMPVEIKEKD